ncbi:hypothetical protein Plhal304r1_c049g0132051 [Plasmopara halstedii]
MASWKYAWYATENRIHRLKQALQAFSPVAAVSAENAGPRAKRSCSISDVFDYFRHSEDNAEAMALRS